MKAKMKCMFFILVQGFSIFYLCASSNDELMTTNTREDLALRNESATNIQRFLRSKQAEKKGLPNPSIERVRKNIEDKQNIEGAGIVIENIEQIDCDQQGYPTIEAIKQLFIAQHYFKADQEIVVQIVKTGQMSDKIYAISIGENPIFFAKISPYIATISDLVALQKSAIGRMRIEALYEDAKLLKKLPILTWIEKVFIYTDPYYNKSRAIEISHAAKGKSVTEILLKGDAQLQIKCMQALGRSLGCFQQLSINYKNSNKAKDWVAVAHGDTHGDNIFFDELKSQIYFIDNESMHNNSNIFKDLDKFLVSYFKNQNTKKDNPFIVYSVLTALIQAYIESFPRDKQLSLIEFLKLNVSSNTDSGLRAIICYFNTLIALNSGAYYKDYRISSLHLAVANKSIEEITRLIDLNKSCIENKDIDGDTPLFWAVHAGNQEIIQLLVQQGADIEVKDARRNSLLFYAASMNDAATVSTLVRLGANVNNFDDRSSRQTPLYIAAILGCVDVVKELLKAPGIDIDKIVTYGKNTVLFYLFASTDNIDNKIEIAQMLIDAGARVTPEMKASNFAQYVHFKE